MDALKHHLVHHRLHMLGCVGGALILVTGSTLNLPAVAIAGAVICAGFCADMVRMMVKRR